MNSVRHTDNTVVFARSQASVLLDLVRGLAAVLVLAEHWRNLLFVSFPQLPPAHRMLWAPFYAVTSAGHNAVVIFFVLSGYLIGGSVFRMLRRGGFRWKTYSTHRLVRLWVVVVPGLVLGALWDSIGLRLQPRLYAGLTGTSMLPDAAANLSAHIFAGNLAFLQTIRVPPLGSNGALWSLAFEFWYYAMFPLALLLVLPRTRPALRVLYAALLAGSMALVGRGILLDFPIWLMGAALALVPALKLGVRTRIAATVLYVPLLLLGGRVVHNGVVLDYTLALATTAYLAVLLSATGASRQGLGERFSRGLSRFSFSLYVLHTPMLLLLAALVLGEGRWQPSLAHLLAGSGLLALVMLLCCGVASLTEFRTDAVRRAVEHGLGMRVERRIAHPSAPQPSQT